MKDKEATKRKLITAVGEIILASGLKNVKISKVAKAAGVDRKLIYRYFGNNLIEAYIIENDYWMRFADHLKQLLKDQDLDDGRKIITQVLQEQFTFFFEQKEMQRLILLELTEKSPLMRSMHNARESLGQQFLESTDKQFEDSGINFRAVAALLVGGIYYMILHTRNNGPMFADVDLNQESGKKAILDSIDKILGWAFDATISG